MLIGKGGEKKRLGKGRFEQILSQVNIFVYYSQFCDFSHLVVECPKLQDFQLIPKMPFPRET